VLEKLVAINPINKIRGILKGENPYLIKNEEKLVKLYTK